MDHFSQIQSAKSLLFGEPDRIMLDEQTIRSHNEYINKKLEYVKTETSYFIGKPGPGRRGVVYLMDKYYPNLVFKNVKFSRLDLVDDIELDVGGNQIDKFYNENNSFQVLQKIYGISDPEIIPIGCLVGNHWLPCLRYQTMKLLFTFKNFDPTTEFSSEDEFKNFEYKITYDVYTAENIHDYQDLPQASALSHYKSQIDWPSTLSFVSPLVQYTGVESLGLSNSAKFKLNFNSLATHFLFSVEPEIEINKFVIRFLHNNRERRLNWSKDNSDNNNIRVDKIGNLGLGCVPRHESQAQVNPARGNYWVVPFTPSLDLSDLQTHGINQKDNEYHKYDIHAQFDVWFGDKGTYDNDTKMHIMAIVVDKFVIYNGSMGRYYYMKN